MTPQELTNLYHRFLIINDPRAEITRLYEKAVKSGALNIDQEPEDSFRLCKIIYYTSLLEMAQQWRPLTDLNRIEAENLQRFL